jgi:hypothetical protein
VFGPNSDVKIRDASPDIDEYMVSETGLTYDFTIEMGLNDIPFNSFLKVTWPQGWILDCTLPLKYVLECTKGC